MAKFEMGYPERTGDAERDLENLYDFVSEMVDRSSYAFRALEKQIGRESNSQNQEE